MLHTTNLRRPRVLFGHGRGLSKCANCGVAFVASHPADRNCSKCTAAAKQKTKQPVPHRSRR